MFLSTGLSIGESSNRSNNEPSANINCNYNQTGSQEFSSSFVVSPEQNRFGSRKGKWTVEEERYTNKVIETFKTGTLQLSSTDKNITLRAYLAEKLDCDPMRITKKYTGASCLGKRVYRSDKVIHNRDEAVENDRQQLESLERDFRLKLQQTNKGRIANSSSMTYQQRRTQTISTPAIDALILQSRRQSNKPPNGVCSISSSNYQPLSQTLSPDTQQMTHDQFLSQLTEEAARVLVGRRAAAVQRDQTQTAVQNHCSEEDDATSQNHSRRSSFPFEEQMYQQGTEWQQNQPFSLRKGNEVYPPVTNDSQLLAQFRSGVTTDATQHSTELPFDKTLFGGGGGGGDETIRAEDARGCDFSPHKKARVQSGEEDGTETAVRSLLGFYHHSQQHLSSLPHRTASFSSEASEGGLIHASLLPRLGDPPGSSPSSRSEESDVSALSTEAVSGCH